MEPEFWQEIWKENRIAFHEGEVNSLLKQHFDRLELREGDRVFVPLCGKALDLPWLLEQGCRVVGIELNRGAVEEVFARMGAEPEITTIGNLTCFRFGDIEIFAGDFFNLSTDLLGPVNAIYDRAALIALPSEMRDPYATHLAELTNRAPQLLIAVEYDQSQVSGPPFSVDGTKIAALYSGLYVPTRLASVEISGPLRERTGGGTENAWLLKAV